jgi:hypothetical protein
MERQLDLPVAPHESRHPFTRGGIQYEAVKGIDNKGMGYAYLEEVALVDGLLKARLYFTRLDVRTKPNVIGQPTNFGVLSAVHTYWQRCIENPVTGEVYKIEENIPVHITNQADLIFFCAFLGMPILSGILNGGVRGPVMGFNEQPIINPDGTWREDTIYMKDETTGEVLVDEAGNPIVDVENSYNTILSANKSAYDKVEPAYIEEEPVEYLNEPVGEPQA